MVPQLEFPPHLGDSRDLLFPLPRGIQLKLHIPPVSCND